MLFLWLGVLLSGTAQASSKVGMPGAAHPLWVLMAVVVGALLTLGVLERLRSRRSRGDRDAREHAACDWLWSADAQCRVTDVRRGRRQLPWLDLAELRQRAFWEIDAGMETPTGMAAAIASRAPFFDVPVSVQRAGILRLLALSGIPRWSPEGAFLGYDGAGRDVTDLVAACASAAGAAQGEDESGNDARNRQSELAIKELESFSYSVSHDLRAPLRIVDGFATIVLEDYAAQGKVLDEVGAAHVKRIVAAGQRMNAMIDTLLGLSKMTSREIQNERVDLSRIAREMADDLAAQDNLPATEFVVAPGLSSVGDRTLLQLVLQNLMGNAAKFSAKAVAPRVEFGAFDERGTTIFFVRDNGAGFDMRFAEKLFGLFQRFHSQNEFPGTGVGLATVQRIVRKHGGRIWAEAIAAPADGHGATFYFTLQ